MDKTTISVELPQSNQLAPAATPAKEGDAAVSRLDFFETLVSKVIEISHLSVFP